MRLFVGIPVSAAVQEKIKVLLTALKQSGADLAAVSPEKLHFTLKFLGDTEENKIEEIAPILSSLASRQKPFSLSLRKVGVFPLIDNIKVIWVGSDSKEFVSLMKEVNAKLNYLRPNEHADEIPHVTLARMKSARNQDKVRAFLEQYSRYDAGTMNLDRFILYASELRPEGPPYTVVQEFKLKIPLS